MFLQLENLPRNFKDGPSLQKRCGDWKLFHGCKKFTGICGICMNLSIGGAVIGLWPENP